MINGGNYDETVDLIAGYCFIKVKPARLKKALKALESSADKEVKELAESCQKVLDKS